MTEPEPTVPCRRCHEPTIMLATKLCDRCWELEHRIQNDPEIAEQIIAEFRGQKHPHTWIDRARHLAGWLLRPVLLKWLRERLCCPTCYSIGTWKPYSYTLIPRAGNRHVRRWLCKWCGAYWSKTEGWRQCCLSKTVWRFGSGETPRSRVGQVNPWVG